MPGRKLNLSLEKYCNYYTQEKFSLKRTSSCFLVHSFPASSDLGRVEAEKRPFSPPPPLPPSVSTWGNLYLRRETFSSLRWKAIEVGKQGMAGGIKKIRTVIIYVMKRCCTETPCDGNIPITLIIIIKKTFTSRDKKLQI